MRDGEGGRVGRLIASSEVRAAADRLTGHIRRTPTMWFAHHALPPPGRVGLKLEHLQHTGAFKARGALHALLTHELPSAGVVAASGGNHGAAVAWAAAQLGCAATVFVPADSPAIKRRRIRHLGGTVELVHGGLGDALESSRSFAATSGALQIHPYDDPATVAGQGTVAVELSEQLPDATTVLVSCGGGGLFAGVAAWYGEDVRVVPVEPESAPTLTAALRAGAPTRVETGGVAVDSLGVRQAGRIAFATARQLDTTTVLVPDEAIRRAQNLLWEELRQITEPGGAAALAALLTGGFEPAADEQVAVVLSGANVDPAEVTATL